MDQSLRTELADGFRLQARVCAKANAPVCAAILEGGGEEVATRGGVLDPILRDWTDPSAEAALSLRILGALHRLALDGRAPDFAAILPTTGGTPNLDRAWPLARALLLAEADFVRSYLGRPPQTNEIGRSALLLGGFLTIAARTGLPLRLFEMGASAGLNLCWDLYRILTPAFSWGPLEAHLTLQTQWEGAPPPQPQDMRVISRRGCDRNPMNLRDDSDRRRLESYIWADQTHRLDRLRRATQVALGQSVRLDQEDAENWLPRQLADPHRGAATVVYHSMFWHYLPAATQSRLRDIIETAGARARSDAPLAWLTMELPNMRKLPELTLTLWPGGETRSLATVHFHGDFVRWRG